MWILVAPWWWIADIVTYFVGLFTLIVLASLVAPRIAYRVSGRLGLYTAMMITGATIVLGGLITVAAILRIFSEMDLAHLFYIALGLTLGTNLVVYLLSPYIIMAMARARPAPPETARMVEDLAARSGLKKPKVLVVDMPPNAFAFGNFLSGRYIAISSSLIDLLPRDELEAVVGHEIGHHVHRDNALMMFLGLFPSMLYYLGRLAISAGLWAGEPRGRESNRGYLLIVGIVAVIISFLLQVVLLAFARLREYFADIHGASLAGPRSMQRALARLHLYYTSRPRALEMVKNMSIRALFIYAFVETFAEPFVSIDRIVESLAEEGRRRRWFGLEEVFSTHPPIPKRIAALEDYRAIIEYKAAKLGS